MKNKIQNLFIALAILAGIATAQAQSTWVTFSVDMAASIAGKTFTPGVDTIEAHGTFNGWGALVLVHPVAIRRMTRRLLVSIIIVRSAPPPSTLIRCRRTNSVISMASHSSTPSRRAGPA